MSVLPPIPRGLDRSLFEYFRALSVAIEQWREQAVTRNVPSDQVLLASPSKKIYAVTVADDGTISATLVQE